VSPWLRVNLLVSILLCARGNVAAQEPAAEERLRFDPIVVTATREPHALGDVPASVSVIEGLDIQGAQRSVGLEESLDRVPGVFVQSSENFAQDVRIQIRGFGTRSAFGIREIRVLLDGLPETQPDGQTILDDIDLDSIDRIEVLRGPAGALYGNASGGVIQLFTEDAPQRPTADVTLSGGSYGFGKYAVKGGGRSGNWQAFMQGSYLQLDGYREHSGTQAGTWLGKLRYDFSDDTDVTVLVNGVESPQADDPGALTLQQAMDTPRMARPLNVELDAGETVSQARFGTTANHRAGWGDLNAYAYVLTRDFSNLLAIPPAAGDGVVTFTRVAPGGGVRWTLATPVFGIAQALTTGVDLQYQDDDRRRFPNIAGSEGPLGLHQREQVGSVGPYLREAVELGDEWELSGGVRYDAVRFDVDVDYPPDSGESDARTFEHVSPTGGVRWSWVHGRPERLRALSLYATVGTAFQTPTTTELGNPDGPGFNPAIDPQDSITYELGGRIRLGDFLVANGAVYDIEVDDLLVPFESLSGRTAYRNAGRTRRFGLELDWQAFLPLGLRWSAAVTLLHTRYQDYQVGEQNFAGNQEPGIPGYWIYQELMYQHDTGIFAALEAFLVDGYFVNDANSAGTDSYQLVNLRAGYQYAFSEHWMIAPFLGLNNLLDQNYVGTVRINALGDRYYEPAPTFNVYGGLSVIATL
jgi:iron complex outermembrane receptor protein